MKISLKKVKDTHLQDLVCSMLIFGWTNHVRASELDDNFKSNETSIFTPEFYKATDDTVLFYVDDIAIHKYDIDEYGIVKDGVLDEQEEHDEDDLDLLFMQPAYSDYVQISSLSATRTLRLDSKDLKPGFREKSNLIITPYQNAAIRTDDHQYAQRTDFTTYYTRLYLTAKKGAQFASKLEYSVGAGVHTYW